MLAADDADKALLSIFSRWQVPLKKTDQFRNKLRRKLIGREDLTDFKALTQQHTADRLIITIKIRVLSNRLDEFGDDAYFVFAEMGFSSLHCWLAKKRHVIT